MSAQKGAPAPPRTSGGTGAEDERSGEIAVADSTGSTGAEQSNVNGAGPSSRFYRGGEWGDPDPYQHALAAITNIFGAPDGAHSRMWQAAAQAWATLYQGEQMQNLARSNRELATSYDAMVDELRLRRGAREDTE